MEAGDSEEVRQAQEIIAGAKSKEKTVRDTYKDVAQRQLDALGQGAVPERLWAYYQGKDIISEFQKLFPKGFNNDSPEDQERKTIESIISGVLEFIPDWDETQKLLATTMSGKPFAQNPNGSVIATSFHLAPKMQKHSGFAPGGGIAKSEWITDAPEANKLAGKIMSSFSNAQQTEGGNIVLLNGPKTMKMTVSAEGKKGSSQNPYSRHIRVETV